MPVCILEFGGSLHELAPDYSDLWRYDPKTGGPTPDDYAGSEVLFNIQFKRNTCLNHRLFFQVR